jgi:hypothetical protein
MIRVQQFSWLLPWRAYCAAWVQDGRFVEACMEAM